MSNVFDIVHTNKLYLPVFVFIGFGEFGPNLEEGSSILWKRHSSSDNWESFIGL